MTDEFVQVLYSMSLFPSITKPTRVTSHCATLIDNIFTNNMENNLVSRLLINDISDHLPVFVIHECNNKRNRECNEVKYRRVRSDESIAAFRKDLINYNWKEVCKETDVNKAYDLFLDIFKNA